MALLKLVSCPAQGDFYSIATMPDASTQPNRSEPSPSISTTDQPIEMDHGTTTQPQEVEFTIETPVSTDPAIIESDTATPQKPTEINVKITDGTHAFDAESVAASEIQLPENTNEIPVPAPSIDVEPDTTTQQKSSPAHNETSTPPRSIFIEDSKLNQEGLAWEADNWGTMQPKWTREPDVEAIKQTVEYLHPGSTVKIEFFGQGAFNKVYTATIDGKEFVIKVVLPVDPWYKTESEVATMRFVRSHTSIPVPEVFAYQSTRDSPIRFEWILMEKMPGKPLGDVFTKIPWEAKVKIVRQLAQYQAELFKYRFKGIGNLYEPSWSCGPIPTPEPQPSQVPIKEKDTLKALQYTTDGASDWPSDDPSEPSLAALNRIVSMNFFWDTRLQQNVPRGPFSSSKDWIAAYLELIQKDCRLKLDQLSREDLSQDEEYDKEDAERTLQLANILNALLPHVLESNQDSEPSIISHGDLNRQNILVSSSGELKAVVDWEFVQPVPLWKACDYAKLLIGPPRLSKPSPTADPEDDTEDPCAHDVDEMWWYEATIYRGIFLEEMRRVEGWMEVFDKSEILRDFDLAVQQCGDEMLARRIMAWSEDVTAGGVNLRSLADRIYNF